MVSEPGLSWALWWLAAESDQTDRTDKRDGQTDNQSMGGVWMMMERRGMEAMEVWSTCWGWSGSTREWYSSTSTSSR